VSTPSAEGVERLSRRVAELAAIGATDRGGVTRLAYTAEERSAHALFAGWVERLGGRVEVDPAGNSVGVLREGEPYVLLGSHLDSVRDGGRFDGAAGVLVALEAGATLAEAHDLPVRVIAFAAEEGARFGRPCLGSAAAGGRLEPGWERRLRDADGRSVAAAAAEVGLAPGDCPPWLAAGAVLAFLEVHIEQGRVLELHDTLLGFVDVVAGSARLGCRIAGLAEHSGATPMEVRRDALAAAAELTLAVERLGLGSRTLRATVGELALHGGGITTVPGSVELGIDIRDVDPGRQAAAVAAVTAAAADICRRRGVEHELRTRSAIDPVLVSAWPRLALQAAAEERGIAYRVMTSGAGHDAAVVARVAPAALLFVPCEGGRSHVPEESCRIDDLVVAGEILTGGALRLFADVARSSPVPRTPEG
jgi:hydantoinase/carbamoylase family amidase